MNLFSEEMLSAFEASVLPTNEACLLPREVYTSEEFFRFEKEAIFHREWLCAGRVDQVPNVGDYL
ncbi:MAG: aromatic ring-hydroxylating dioxygenase subunit alpha, partial [Gammaproteobacteria bacterium]|nr:aromatic ring-hydroxylating dioxygenase subunit alpha [Gammaproteobacteria bacterium]